jgi:hypothetical protein
MAVDPLKNKKMLDKSTKDSLHVIFQCLSTNFIAPTTNPKSDLPLEEKSILEKKELGVYLKVSNLS